MFCHAFFGAIAGGFPYAPNAKLQLVHDAAPIVDKTDGVARHRLFLLLEAIDSDPEFVLGTLRRLQHKARRLVEHTIAGDIDWPPV